MSGILIRRSEGVFEAYDNILEAYKCKRIETIKQKNIKLTSSNTTYITLNIIIKVSKYRSIAKALKY